MSGNAVLPIDSSMEVHHLQIAIARTDVVKVAVQSGPYYYFRDGRRHSHYFDSSIWHADGSWHLSAVRPKDASSLPVLIDTLKRVHEDDERLADAYIHLVTEDNLAPWQIQRAIVINHCLEMPDDEADGIAWNFICQADAGIRIVDVHLGTDLAERCLPAVARLLAQGRVSLPHGAPLNFDAIVTKAETDVGE